MADWKRSEFFREAEYCNEFVLTDLRKLENCVKATEGCKHVYNLATSCKGYLEDSLLLYNNTMISFNVLEAARKNGSRGY